MFPLPPKNGSQLLLCPQTLPGDSNAISRTQVKMGGSPQGRGKKEGLTLQRGKKGREQHMVTPPPPQNFSGLCPPPLRAALRSGCSMPSPSGGCWGAPPALPSTRCLPVPPGKECDLNRQCGVRNPDTNKLCTRLLTCKVVGNGEGTPQYLTLEVLGGPEPLPAVAQIHSVHQRREVQGRAKDFDVLVAELKASTRRGEPPKDRSPPEKDPLHPALQDTPSLLQPPNTPLCRARLSHCLHPPR